MNYFMASGSFFSAVVFLFSGMQASTLGAEKEKSHETPVQAELRESLKEPFKNPPDIHGLPRVLIIGDSISIGYTVPLRNLLDGKALVFRAPVNCNDSGTGLKNIEQWIGKGKWDVIHFNFGIWDTFYLNAKTGQMLNYVVANSMPANEKRILNDLPQYRDNLVKIVNILKKTKAQLIWAQSTPIADKTIVNYNAEAAKVMKGNGVTISDLYTYAQPNLQKWQIADKCHFNDIGYQMLAEHVMATVLEALKQKKANWAHSIKNNSEEEEK